VRCLFEDKARAHAAIRRSRKDDFARTKEDIERESGCHAVCSQEEPRLMRVPAKLVAHGETDRSSQTRPTTRLGGMFAADRRASAQPERGQAD
jgi:hypothetical protein